MYGFCRHHFYKNTSYKYFREVRKLLFMGKIEIRKLVLVQLGFLLYFCLLLPSILVPLKTIVLISSTGLSLLCLRQEKFNANGVLGGLLIVLVGLWGSFYGVIKGNPGAIPVLPVFVIYPALYLVLGMAYRASDSEKLLKLLLVASVSVGLFLTLYTMLTVSMPGNPLTQFLSTQYADRAVVDEGHGEYFKFTLPTVTSILFLLPFCIGVYFSQKRYRGWALISIVSLLIPTILSGRRGIFVSVIAGVLFALLFTSRRYHNPDNQLNWIWLAAGLGGFALFLFLFSIYSVGFEFYLTRLASITDFTGDGSNTERRLQFDALLSDILKAPMLGSGAGAAGSYLRSTDMPWAYELSYVSMVFHYGMLGGLMLLGVALTFVYNIIRMVGLNGRDSLYFPFLMGMVSFLLANATNPYLGKFDYIWVILLPMIFMMKNNAKRQL